MPGILCIAITFLNKTCSGGISSDVDRHERTNGNLYSNCDNCPQPEENKEEEKNIDGKDIDCITDLEKKDCAAFKQSKNDESLAMNNGLVANSCSTSFGMTEEENREFWNMLLTTETGSGINILMRYIRKLDLFNDVIHVYMFLFYRYNYF